MKNLPQKLLERQAKNFKELEKLTKCKNNQNILLDFYNQFDQTKAERCEKCSKVVIWSHQKHLDTGEERLKVKEKRTCKNRFCACCCWDRQRKLSKLFFLALTKLLECMKVRYLFVTFTVRNPDISDLKQEITLMQQSFGRMIKTKKWQKSILGYCRVLEITKPKAISQKDKIHPHFHVLLAVKPSYFTSRYKELYLTKNDYAGIWQKSLRVDYNPVCDIRIVRPRNAKKGNVTEQEANSQNAINSSIAEMIKYPMKDTDLKRFTVDEFKSIDAQMKGIRAINFGGILKEMNKQVANLDKTELDDEDLKRWIEIQEIITKYLREIQGYKVLDSRKT